MKNIGNREGFMSKNQIREINAKHGFDYLGKSRRYGLLWQKQNIRIRTSAADASGDFQVCCETMVPYKSKDILHFLVSGEERPTSSLRVMEDQILIKDIARSSGDYEKIVTWASNLDILVQDDDLLDKLKEFISPFPKTSYTAEQIEEKVLRLLGRRLQQLVAVQVHAASYTLSAYLDAMGVPRVYEVKPVCLLGVSERMRTLGFLMENATRLKGAVVIVNMDILVQEDLSYTVFMASFQSLNQLPEYGCGRFILCHSVDARMENNPVPCISLPDIYRSAYSPMLERAGIPMKVSTLHALPCLMKTGLTQREIISELEEESKLLQSDDVSGMCLLEDGLPTDESADTGPSIGELRLMANNLFERHVAGHAEILPNLIQTLLTWHLLRINKPLVLSFCGPSGTGKNHICRVIAMLIRRLLNTSSEQYVPFNAGNLVGRTGLWALTGVQAGLKGMHSKGILETIGTGGVLSIDEMDKVSSQNDMQDFLVSVLEDGTFRNGHGRLIRLPRCVIVLTMNAGPDASGENCREIGFVKTIDKDKVKEHYRDYFERSIHPALRGRISRSYFFGYLSREELIQLGVKELNNLQERFVHFIDGAWPIPDNEAAVRLLADTLDVKLGARGMLHAVEGLWNDAFDAVCKTF